MATNAAKITVTMAEAQPLIMDIFRPRLTPMLVSSPGLGKSALYRLIAEMFNLMLIDVRLSQADPSDLNGFPWIQTADQNIHKKLKAGYVPMETFPVEGDPIPEGYKGWLLVMDEFNSAAKMVEAAAYKITLDRMVGMHKLHKNCFVGAAGNLLTDKAIVNQTGTAMQSRLIWLEIVAHLGSWLQWADRNDVDHRVKSYLQFKPEMLHNFDPKHNDKTFPCPRTWDFLSQIIRPWPETIDIKKLPLLAGTVGTGAAREFFSYCQIYEGIPTIDRILKDPANVPFGEEPSMHYALAGLVSNHMNTGNAKQLFTFIDRLGADFQVNAVRAALAKDRTLKESEHYKSWYSARTWELVYN